MEITSDLIKTIYERSKQFSLAGYAKNPDDIILYDDGDIVLKYYGYENDYDTETIAATDLTCDLEPVILERKEREAKEQIERENQRIIYEKRYNKQKKEQRRSEYLKLKKEFE